MAFNKEYYEAKLQKLTQKFDREKHNTLQKVISEVLAFIDYQNEYAQERKEIDQIMLDNLPAEGADAAQPQPAAAEVTQPTPGPTTAPAPAPEASENTTTKKKTKSEN